MRVIDLRLPPRPEAVPRARGALDDLAGMLSPGALEDARLMASELVTNCIRHAGLRAGQRVGFRAEVDGPTLRIEVRDLGAGFTLAPRTAGSADDSGWGLYLVGRLADRWGVSSDGATTVWFEIALDRDDRERHG